MLSETSQSNKDKNYMAPLCVCRVFKFIEIRENGNWQELGKMVGIRV